MIHVVDASAENRALHQEEVNRVLAELGASEKPQLLVLNKCDLLDEEARLREVGRERQAGAAAGCVGVSARTGSGLDRLLDAVDRVLAAGAIVRRRYRLPYSESRNVAKLYERARILARRDLDDGVELEAEVTPALASRLDQFAIPD